MPQPSSESDHVEIHSAREIDMPLRNTLEAWFGEEFGHVAYQWAEPDWYVTVARESKLAGRLAIVERTIAVGAQLIRVGGIAGVATRREWRNRGVASVAMRAAAGFIARDLRRPFGLLLCRRQVSPVYAKLGWETVEGPTSFMQPSGPVTYPHLTMVMRFGEQPWPIGPIDLSGLPW
jgi:aminoglycoside 2'-N-acetyltransferase I